MNILFSVSGGLSDDMNYLLADEVRYNLLIIS